MTSDRLFGPATVKIYIAKNKKQTGPFKDSLIRQQLAAGLLTGDELAWHESLTEWQPLREMFPGDMPEGPATPAWPANPPAPAARPAPPASPAPVSLTPDVPTRPSAQVPVIPSTPASPPPHVPASTPATSPQRRVPVWGKMLLIFGGLFALIGLLVAVLIVIGLVANKQEKRTSPLTLLSIPKAPTSIDRQRRKGMRPRNCVWGSCMPGALAGWQKMRPKRCGGFGKRPSKASR